MSWTIESGMAFMMKGNRLLSGSVSSTHLYGCKVLFFAAQLVEELSNPHNPSP
ncbi:MAG: hypothetical protein WBQ16_08240 [Nitrososphaeraceae archaeon]